MPLEKNYYSVSYKRFNHRANEFVAGKYEFDNLELPIRFRREDALNKFFALYENQNELCLQLSYHEHYFQQELGEDAECLTQRSLIELTNGILHISWLNWANETRDYKSKGEVCIGKLVKAKLPDGGTVEVYNDKICRKLDIPFDYFDWEE